MLIYLDPRTKGFTKEGIFQSDGYRSIYSLFDAPEKSKELTHLLYIPCWSIFTAYILATETQFFGKTFNNNSWSDLYASEDVIFIVQLLTKNIGIFSCNGFKKLSDVKYHFLIN